MHARNLGVVFGRTYHLVTNISGTNPNIFVATLMRSSDPNAEFSDMAGKALSIEFLVENAPMVFSPPS